MFRLVKALFSLMMVASMKTALGNLRHLLPHSIIWLLCRPGGTVVKSYDLTTCSSWVQVPNGICSHHAMVINKSLKASQAYNVVQAGLDRQRLLCQRRIRRWLFCCKHDTSSKSSKRSRLCMRKKRRLILTNKCISNKKKLVIKQ